MYTTTIIVTDFIIVKTESDYNRSLELFYLGNVNTKFSCNEYA